MSNCTGVIYGKVKDSGGSPLSGVEVSLNWIQRAEGGALTVGGDDDLKTFVPNCTTTGKGNYIIPFFWASTQVPGNIASALAMRWYGNNNYTPSNKHGVLGMGVDLRKLIAAAAPAAPSGGTDAANMFLTFFLAAKSDLKGMDIASRFVNSFALLSSELQGCYCNIDFVF